MPFLFVFFLDSYDSNTGAFNIVAEVSEVVLISFKSFFFFPLCLIYFHHSIFHLTYPLFCLSYSTVGSLQSVLISVIALFIIDWLFFISSRFSSNISCIYSILVSSLFICNSILFSNFWIIFTIIILNIFQAESLSPLLFGLVGIYHVLLPAEYFSAFSFCFDCCVWGALSVGWNFVALLLWSLLSVGGVGLAACQGFPVGRVWVWGLVGGAESLLSDVQWNVK